MSHSMSHSESPSIVLSEVARKLGLPFNCDEQKVLDAVTSIVQKIQLERRKKQEERERVAAQHTRKLEQYATFFRDNIAQRGLMRCTLTFRVRKHNARDDPADLIETTDPFTVKGEDLARLILDAELPGNNKPFPLVNPSVHKRITHVDDSGAQVKLLIGNDSLQIWTQQNVELHDLKEPKEAADFPRHLMAVLMTYLKTDDEAKVPDNTPVFNITVSPAWADYGRLQSWEDVLDYFKGRAQRARAKAKREAAAAATGDAPTGKKQKK